MTNPGQMLAQKFVANEALDKDAKVTVQPYAHVIGVDEDWNVVAASEGCEDITGVAVDKMQGAALADVLSIMVVHALRSKAQVLCAEGPVARMQGLVIPDRNLTMDATVTVSGTYTFFEFEPAENSPSLATETEQIQRLILRVARKADIRSSVLEAAATLRALSGFERVSVHPVTRSGLGPAIGGLDKARLRGAPAPASLRAHASNFSAYLHLIPDVSAETRRLQFHQNPEETQVELRADPRVLCSYGVSPDLQATLKKEDVAAALTIPIRKGGELWGVFVCHHSEPRTVSVGARSAMDLFALLFGYELERLDEKIAAKARQAAGDLRDTILTRLGQQPDFAMAVRDIRPEINEIIPHDGMVLWHGGQFTAAGNAVSQRDFEPIFAHLSQNVHVLTSGINRLSDAGISLNGLDPSRTAVLVIRLSRQARDYLLLFRDLEHEQESLACWYPWEIEAAKVLRGALVEAAFKLHEDARETHLRTREHQGLLIAELNHRVRNILNLIQGIVGQSKTGARSVEGYSAVLEQRLHALARAHDELTEKEWGWVDINSLLSRELDPYLDETGARILIEGDSVDLSPAAFSTMALVVHELVSNARKFGALSKPNGEITISILRQSDGFVSIRWTEKGGPPLTHPGPRGFGLTIIEQSVPYELRGMTKVNFDTEGLHVEFRLPPGHIAAHRPRPEDKQREPKISETLVGEISIDGVAMILDDSLIISMDAADMLKEAGATDIYSCNSVETAFDALDDGDVTFALLDVNLGVETSLAVAEQLWTDGIPAALATGYGANEDLLADFPPMPVLTKPYTLSDVQDVLRMFRNRDRDQTKAG